jgi:isochorismate hydrolase
VAVHQQLKPMDIKNLRVIGVYAVMTVVTGAVSAFASKSLGYHISCPDALTTTLIASDINLIVLNLLQEDET